ncbi:bifunctional ornithine acetyltransferase/N-acetylglutamate synthase, partial [Bacillus cereus group sp. N8]|nr:bifunctional ornithine acetyltransferase/N-acetylglutamate synthase [Bacillus cereus group sp. N8]
MQGIIGNSGSASACSGLIGLQEACELGGLGADHFGVKEKCVAVG